MCERVMLGNTCPRCGVPIEPPIDVTPGEIPRAQRRGDLGICSGCYGWLVCVNRHDVRAMTDDEWQALSETRRAELTRVLETVRARRTRHV